MTQIDHYLLRNISFYTHINTVFYIKLRVTNFVFINYQFCLNSQALNSDTRNGIKMSSILRKGGPCARSITWELVSIRICILTSSPVTMFSLIFEKFCCTLADLQGLLGKCDMGVKDQA